MSLALPTAANISQPSFLQVLTGYWGPVGQVAETKVVIEAVQNRDVRHELIRRMLEIHTEWAIDGLVASDNSYVTAPIGEGDALIISFPLKTEDNVASLAIHELEETLGLPIQRILAAADIKSRTYYSWKEAPSTEPRVGSLGRLWSLIQFKNELIDLVEPFTWLKDPQRLELFERGQFDEILNLAVKSIAQPRSIDGQGSISSSDEDLLHSVSKEKKDISFGTSRNI